MQHMPLVDINQATLIQMTDTSFATRDEFHVIADWQQDIHVCRTQMLAEIQRVDPLYVPVVLTGWDNDDQTLVLLAGRKLDWGDAVMRLRLNRAETLTKAAEQISRSMTQLDQDRQAALNRKASFINAVIGAIP